MKSIFHAGEKAVQKMVGEDKIAEKVGRMISSMITGNEVGLIQKQPLAIVGSVDGEGKLWASLLIGDMGFVEVPNEHTLTFEKKKIHSATCDIFFSNIQRNPAVGMLFIEMATRRRFRVNGLLKEEEGKMQMQVQEAYANCPKYIQRNQLSLPEQREERPALITQGNHLTANEKDWILQAHTFFMATQSAEGKVDVSHRGGNAGFIEVINDDTLRIPDYPGNSLFNSLGNIYENPQTGLLFIDFEKGETLQLTGKGELHFTQNSTKDLKKTGDTGRFWLFKPTQWVRVKHHHQVNWEFIDYSPFNP